MWKTSKFIEKLCLNLISKIYKVEDFVLYNVRRLRSFKIGKDMFTNIKREQNLSGDKNELPDKQYLCM